MKKLLLGLLLSLCLASNVWADSVTVSQTSVNNYDLATSYPFNAAQGFKVSTTGSITRFTVQLKYSTLVLVGTLTGYIYSDDGTGKPNAALATFSSMNAATITTTPTDYDFTGTFIPTANTQYHIVVLWTGGVGAGNLHYSSDSTNPYADGVFSFNQGGAWDNTSYATYDLYFKIWQNAPPSNTGNFFMLFN